MEKKIDLRGRRTKEPAILHGFGGDNGLESYAATSRYLVRNGRPCFPVMGEFHFSRYPAQFWEESILKMKAGGISVLSTYIFWIHHEEERGVWDWKGNKNLHDFIALCQKHQMRVILRIGPWAHGECRNGGFPDWLVHLGIPLRENDERYFALVKSFYSEIYRQVRGFLFYEGGPVVGVQIENEYGHCGGLQGEAGKRHILTLKEMAVKLGFRVPFYTNTGWGNGVVVEGETLPVLGGYVEAPWEQHTQEKRAAPEYLFRTVPFETSIGDDLTADETAGYSYDVSKYPYLTAELGGGLEPTHHRRPIVSADDTGAMALVYLGSGANLLGYYMYHGGTNPIGKLSTLQESKETGYPNDVPELSYDFQAPINEYGELNPSYGRLKALHMFLRDFGEEMAESECYLSEDNPSDAENMGSLRYSVRFGRKGGFLFLNNYQRRRRMTDKTPVDFTIVMEDGTYRFPDMRLPDGKYAFYPFHLSLGGLSLLSATAQLLCRVKTPKDTIYVFFCDETETANYHFLSDQVIYIGMDAKKIKDQSGYYEMQVDRSEFYKAVPITLWTGETIKILTISRQDAFCAWKFEDSAGEHFLISQGGLYEDGDVLKMTSRSRSLDLLTYPPLPKNIQVLGASCDEADGVGDFSRYMITYDTADRLPEVRKIGENPIVDGGISYEFSVTRSLGKSIEDDFLNIRFSGDRARLFLDGRFCADWFYNGLEWRIGLKRFGDIDGKLMRVDVVSLHESDAVFLEKKPEYHNGVACSIDEISIEPEYYCKIIFNGAT